MLFVAFYKNKKISFYKVGATVSSFDPKVEKPKFKDKRILVIGDVIYLKKVYPKTNKQNLELIIKNELEEDFEDKELSFFYDFEEKEEFVELNIYAYQKTILEEVKKVFDYQYAISEWQCFFSKEPTMVIFKEEDYYNIVAFCQKPILTTNLNTLTSQSIKLFLKSLYPFEPKKIINYTDIDLGVESIEVYKAKPSNYPIFLNYISNINFRAFKIFKGIPFDFYFAYRLLFYVLFAYTCALYVNINYYNYYIKSLKEVHKKLLKTLSETHQSQKPKNLSKDFYKEYKAYVKYQNPIFVFKTISKILTKDSYITYAELSPTNIKMNINTQDPFNILNNISNDGCIKSFHLNSPIQKAFGGDFYSLNMELTLCKR